MKHFGLISLLVTAIAACSCSPAKPLATLKIHITSSGYSIEGTEYKSKGELITALKGASSGASVVAIKQEANTKPERLAEAIEAVKEAGITAPVALVGNEVFQK